DRRPLGSTWAGLRCQLRAHQRADIALARPGSRTRGRATRMSLAADVRASLEPRRGEMIETLRDLVEIESPSDARAALDRFAGAVRELFGGFGPIEALETPRGTNFLVRVDGAEASPHAVALCHYDTVWPLGTLASIPFTVDAQGVARGPGCF